MNVYLSIYWHIPFSSIHLLIFYGDARCPFDACHTQEWPLTTGGLGYQECYHSGSDWDCLIRPRMAWPVVDLGDIKHGFVVVLFKIFCLLLLFVFFFWLTALSQIRDILDKLFSTLKESLTLFLLLKKASVVTNCNNQSCAVELTRIVENTFKLCPHTTKFRPTFSIEIILYYRIEFWSKWAHLAE